MTWPLKPAELLYRGINRLRRALYRAGVLRPKRLPVPVISVGNIAMVRRHGIKVIYITGDPGQVPSGFIDVRQTPLLAKPFDADILLTVVESALGRPK